MSVTPDDLQARDAWVTEHLLAAQPPFSFRYGGHPSDALLADALTRVVRSEIAAYALVVDAKDEKAADFYRRHGFLETTAKPLTLFLPLATAPVPKR